MEGHSLDVKTFYEYLLNELDIGIHAVNEDGKTIIYNQKMMEIESMDKHEVLNKSPLEVFAFKDNQSSTLMDALRGKPRRNITQTYFNNRGKEITTINDTVPIIYNGKIKGAVEIVKDITKLRRTIEKTDLERKTKFTFDRMLGRSPAFLAVVQEARRASRTSSSVLLIGETGTGKEVFAKSIHNESSRAAKPFISQNCAAIPESLMESTLFGTAKGAFTGAIDKPGLFEEANGGTLLLDEINSLSPHLQAKLLRVIQERTVRRVGGSQEKEIDVRLIATMNEDPIEAITHNRMRKDLYYRLSVVTLFLPPLRERTEDIELLTQGFIQKYNALFNMEVTGIDEHVKEYFLHHDWPGNVRELEHMIEGAMNLVEEDIIQLSHLPGRITKRHAPEMPKQTPLKKKIDEAEQIYIKQLLQENGGNISKTARMLGLSRQSLQYRLKKYNI
ncbi:sigma 54-interacting transcriptional regulator [Ectobacillus sp. JY-23]|uniref:sigma-54 interaction domain-containing protein n=1 Tax=Ectobacillus sp. JY-23 TaxID=2933872 RepID=UPI001FF60D22|nr:sigma 54-interacting transcriptional regulator [Ectobacillus sp. JY-23]UOY91197.1 sigma 54-interacting transcriptional regulator [Ectobacillus sp. JY-23]